ncbi:Guanine nucleotide-binding protein subunit alpha-13 [Echinococcus granulosus]|uniref:Guanine nucleotide-binding protein subunit alpha-13 n=1 Tax=Echinococcus granulosus TaxID=6210 RepID=W6UH74_ECHGR|nr:Guanine nucleotide-binding protein subunit alpha-13 [Echinococcus granulosus]EUB60393.1 Guanine nucleotide-binding protein subunit alpha-13 [Echinococcus granulosus]
MLRPNFTLNCCKILDFYGSVHAEEESDRIDKRIRKRNKKVLKPLVQKILLLGTGESGKSTFLKQMRIITGKSFTNFELETFKSVIYDNIYKGVLYLLQLKEQFKLIDFFFNLAECSTSLTKTKKSNYMLSVLVSKVYMNPSELFATKLLLPPTNQFTSKDDILPLSNISSLGKGDEIYFPSSLSSAP